MELDTGVTVSTMSLAQFKKLCPGIQIRSMSVKLKTYTGEIIYPVGTSITSINWRPNCYRKESRCYIVKVLTRNYEDDLQKLLQEHSDVISDELREIPNCSYKFRIKNDNVQPIFYKPRQVPYALIGKVEDEIARLERLGVIEQVTHSQWGTPVVQISKKDRAIRLCAAYNTTINNAIDTFNKMSGGLVDSLPEI
ncbi:hypothetical protein QE152_g37053 [Popillia japonica]|uniref:Uncharacterized protein n=1 Tax=Popillia japonica TaxID=7064 RepID=A0AAW1IBS1_POPJA